MSIRPIATAAPAASAAFLAAGAATAALYVLAQLFQRWAFEWGLPPAPEVADQMARRLLAVDRMRQVAVLASLALIPVGYAALALEGARRAPGAALLGLVFGTLFSTFEIAYRSIDLLAGGAWAAQFLAAADAATRTAIAARFALFDDAVRALYLPLLFAHGLSAAAFAVALRRERDLAGRLLAVALAANAVRAVLRSGEMHAGLEALAPLNRALYLPVTLATYGLLAYWLARAAGVVGSAPCPPATR